MTSGTMYGLMHGENELATVLLAALGLTRTQVPRYRDCYWDGTHICVHTRTGGGNRDHYEERNPENLEGPWNSTLRDVAGYVRDEDEEYDATYATFYFVPPAVLQEALAAVPAVDATPSQRWQSLFERLEAGVSDPQIERAKAALQPILDQITGMAK